MNGSQETNVSQKPALNAEVRTGIGQEGKKKCSKCGIEKGFKEFHKDKNTKDNHCCFCKQCNKLRNKKYHKNNVDSIKKNRSKHYLENKKEYSERNKIYIKNNKINVSKRQKEYYQNNKEKILARQTEYEEKNKNKNSKRRKIKWKTDFKFRINSTLRLRLTHELRGIKKVDLSYCFDLLGCNIDFFIKHIEDQFIKNMNWDNHSKYGWHLDHIIPVSSYDLSDEKQRKECFHYTNLQPLWAEDNLRKGAKNI